MLEAHILGDLDIVRSRSRIPDVRPTLMQTSVWLAGLRKLSLEEHAQLSPVHYPGTNDHEGHAERQNPHSGCCQRSSPNSHNTGVRSRKAFAEGRVGGRDERREIEGTRLSRRLGQHFASQAQRNDFIMLNWNIKKVIG